MRHSFKAIAVAGALACGLAVTPARAANLTTTNAQGAGSDWTAPIWKTNGTGTAVSPLSGNTYQCVFNGIRFGNAKNNTRIRNPVLSPAGTTSFPGDSLTLGNDTEIRIKGPGMVLHFPGIGTNPGLILDGGILNVGDDAVFSITGRVRVASQSYIAPGDNGGGAAKPLRGVRLTGQLSGAGSMVIFQAGTNVAQEIAGNDNIFTGTWIVKAGWLLGSGTNSLGTNSITLNPAYVLPLDSSIVDVPGPALIEPAYDLNSAGTLTLVNGGKMKLHQDCFFAAVSIEGVLLGAGRHSFDELAGSFPNNFVPGGSGSITVQPYAPPGDVAPSFVSQPSSCSVFAGSSTQMVARASGTMPLAYRWQKGTNGIFVNVTNTTTVLGAATDTLTFAPASLGDAADYRLIVTNLVGSATSQMATLTVLPQDLTPPTVTAVTPSPGAGLPSLTQVQVTFSETVLGVVADDLRVNGASAISVSGSGANYVFTVTPPAPGPVLVFWDIDTAITDRAGNPLVLPDSWTYTLLDGTTPVVASTTPADGATVSALSLAQVFFSEPVQGVRVADLLVNGVAATNVDGSGFGPYVFQFPAPAEGPVLFSWSAGNEIRDQSSNRLVSAGWKVTLTPSSAIAALTNLVINEFLASNQATNGLRDEDLELQDWLELYNRGSTVVNLAGWSITDDPDQPLKWVMPATNIAAGGYLVIFASGKDRRQSGARLHTNFRLNSGGSYLGLYNADFPPKAAYAYAPAYPEQRTDISCGLDSAGSIRFFAQLTPGAANSSSSLTGVVARVFFGVKHGFFNQPFNLILTTTTPGASIVYTTDGSEPGISGGVTNGTVYLSPLSVGRTTVLRAAAFAPGLIPSGIETRSYFFVEDIVHQPNEPDGYPVGNVWTPTPGTVQTGSRAYYEMDPTIVEDPQYSETVRAGLLSIPTMSIVSPIDGLFGAVNGIYSHPQNRGPAWERACSMELMFPEGDEGLQVNCGVQIQGGTQRDPAKNPKHSFKVVFKGQYGPGRLDFPMFPGSATRDFNALVLDGGINYWWNYVGGNAPADQRYRAQCVRDQFTSDLMLAAGQASFHGRFYHVYLNGLYWGLHYVHEMPDDAFAESYYGGSRADYDIIKNTSAGNELIAGDYQAWDTALSLSNSGLTNNAQFAELRQYVDVDNLIDYMLVNHWVGNDDWPRHNWYVIRKRAPGEGFKFMVWDAEHVLKDRNINRTTASDTGTPAQIYGALRSNAEFRLMFADHIQKRFFNGGIFYTDPDPARAVWNPAHPERNVPAAYYMKRIAEIDTAIVDESARWGGYLLTTNYTRNEHWLRELNNLLGYTNNPGNTYNFFPLRSSIVLGQYKTLGLFPSLSAPVFSQHGGIVPLGFALTLSNPNNRGKVYYTTDGTDPRVYATGAVVPGASLYQAGTQLALNNSLTLKARVLDTEWSALTEAQFNVATPGIPVRITELMYSPIGGGAYEFIELQNIGASPVDMSGYSFEGITYVFPEGSILAPGALIVLGSSANPAAFASRYPGVVAAGWFDNALANIGERIALLDRSGNAVVSVDYKNSGGWPVAADGGGYSLEILDPNGDPDDPANWRASENLNGSPGFATSTHSANPIRLNEVMAENAGAVTNAGVVSDWVELQNAGSNSVSLGQWSLSDGGNPRKFVFPSGATIAGGGYLVVWCDTRTDVPGLHSGFALGRKGESLFLYDANTNRVDALTFGPQLTNYTIGRFGLDGRWDLAVPTPGSNNIPAACAPATNLVINEWLANPTPGEADWLELFNRSGDLPVALSGISFVASNGLFQLKSLSFVPPRGFIQLLADRNPGPAHLDLTLRAAGDAIVLYDALGHLVDQVAFSAQAEAVSQGRLPDGAPAITSFPGSPSPGASNYVNSYAGPVLNELMARNASAIYDPHGNNPDWVELYNPNSVSYPLAGMGLAAGADGPLWAFPAEAAVPALGFLVVWLDASCPARTNVANDLNTGFALSGSGDTLRLLNTAGQVVDAISFGPQVSDFSIGRSEGGWHLLAEPTPRTANTAPATLGDVASLRVNEWMAAPAKGEDWFELHNSGASPLSLAGLYLTDNPSLTGTTNSPIGPLSFIAAQGWAQFIADGQPGQGPNHVNFSLSRDGGTLRLYASDLALIDGVDFGLQATGTSQGRLPDGAADILSFDRTPTPGESNYLPLQTPVINEVLAHTDPPLEDALELYNPDVTSVQMGGWYISNSETALKKYRIPDGFELGAGGYAVFYEYQLLSSSSPFTFNSARGDRVYISETDSLGNLTGRRAQVSFDATPNGASVGRYPTSAGIDFVPLSSRTFGADSPQTLADFRTGTGLTNAYPAVGPVVINEIIYHPVTWSGTNAVENHAEEFVELFNASASPLPLYDLQAATNTWKLSGGVDFSFPQGVVVPANGCVVVVGFDPLLDSLSLTAFLQKYPGAAGAPIYGPFSGKLDNAGETLQLFRPDHPQAAPHPDAGFVPYVLVDHVVYSNAPPWPPAANGTGMSLQRRAAETYGNEPLNWLAAYPTPGKSDQVTDSDGDGLPDAWEVANGLDKNSAVGPNGAGGDPDGDGFTNLQEYIAGTAPNDSESCLRLNLAHQDGGGALLRFAQSAGHSYTIQYTDDLSSGAWAKLADFDPVLQNSTTELIDPGSGTGEARFYRLTTPRLP